MPSPFQHILFPVDFSTSCEQIVPWVVETAKSFGARITVLNVLESPHTWSGDIDPFLLESLTDIEAMVQRRQMALEKFRKDHLPWAESEAVVRRGDAADQIAAYVSEGHIDLIMMPTHGYGRFRAALLGSVTAKVIHDTVCPVWTSTHAEQLPTPVVPYRIIMCAVSDDHGCIETIRNAQLMSQYLECSLIIVHAVPPGKSEGESRLASRLESCPSLEETNVPMCFEQGEIETVVAGTAKRYGADLLVIGRGHAPELLGTWRSHVYSILRNSPCPVLTL